MFKFMKSKKGFSLVELMIVVVIMAILVAVAVPIFNSVTGNARAKTCVDNQRSIISAINTDLLENPVAAGKTATITITTNADADGATMTGDMAPYADGHLDDLFQTIPYCPVKNAVITVKVAAPDDGGVTVITTSCNNSEDLDAHTVS